MALKLFNFDQEFKLGIEAVDNEHIRLVDMLDEVHTLMNAGKKDEAIHYFNKTLSAYVNEHFDNEEEFMKSFDYPQLDEHRKIHQIFKNSFIELSPKLENFDNVAFRQALSNAYAWIISHIGKTDRKYADYYLSQQAR